MFKKSLVIVMFVAMTMFGLGIAQAATIDGLQNTATPALPSALTMHVNPGGLGDALIYGYFNARNAYNYFRVINTSTTQGVAVKVRFREGADSNEILDFFVCLSATDQWSAWVIGDATSSNPAQLYWYDDDTPTYPDPQGNDVATDNMLASRAFAYSASGAAAAVSADDTKEGYFEIIGVSAWADTPGSTKIVKTPNQCGETVLGTAVVDAASFTRPSLVDVNNVLAGNLYLFDLSTGAETYAYNATAISDFRLLVVAAPGLATDDQPLLSNATDIDTDANTHGLNEMNFILTKANEYVVYDISGSTGLNGNTDFITTFPTKRISISVLSNGGGADTTKATDMNNPFNNLSCIHSTGVVGTWSGASCVTTVTVRDETNGRCEEIVFTVYDDAENTPVGTIGFSPAVVGTEAVFCDEVNVVTLGTTESALLSTNLKQFNLDVTYALGWMKVNLQQDSTNANDHRSIITGAVVSATANGLPAISYELGTLVDGGLTGMLPVRYDTNVTNP